MIVSARIHKMKPNLTFTLNSVAMISAIAPNALHATNPCCLNLETHYVMMSSTPLNVALMAEIAKNSFGNLSI